MGFSEQWGGRVATPAHRITVAQLEAALGRHTLDFDSLRDNGAEYARFPSMVAVFSRLCTEKAGIPPTQREFVEGYRECNHLGFPDLFDEDRWRGTRARLLRAHPSFVRDYHLEAMLAEAGFFCLSGEGADRIWGVDMVLVMGTFAIRLNCFIGTGAGMAWRLSKRRRRGTEGLQIDLPLFPTEARWVGPYQLYGPQHVENIRGLATELARTASQCR